MKSRLIITTVLLLLLSACGNDDESRVEGTINSGDLPPALETAPQFSLKNSAEAGLAYEGYYKGLFPCADCEATELTLELQENRFKRSIRRIGKDEKAFTDQGNIAWDSAGVRFQLENDSKSKYLVADGKLFQLGLDGTQCMQHNGEAFILNAEKRMVNATTLTPAIDISDDTSVKTVTEMSDTQHSSPAILDYAGIYRGVYPCADCDGIEIRLELTDDNGFTRTATYLGADKTFTDSGEFEWNEADNRIHLISSEAEALYLVKAGELQQLNLNGDELESLFEYRLLKVDENNEEIYAPFNDGHNAQNSLSYAGTYRGVFPCADCEGIEVQLTIDYDDNFKRVVTYLGVENQPIISNGTFKWNEMGNSITLEGLDDGEVAHYFIGENTIYQLDQNMERIESVTGSDYSLQLIDER